MLTIRLNGVLTRLAGTEVLSLDVPTQATVDEVMIQLGERYPALVPQLQRTACAVGDELVPRSQRVRPGGELILIPPVSGG
ncbi:MAG: MoaD/ThiS family protein [Nevskiales bacterium]